MNAALGLKKQMSDWMRRYSSREEEGARRVVRIAAVREPACSCLGWSSWTGLQIYFFRGSELAWMIVGPG